MARDFMSAVENRRSMYALSSESTLSHQEIEDLVRHAVKHCPTANNSQTGRVIILFGEHHIRLWDIIEEALKKVVPEKRFPRTQAKIETFRQGYASLLFFEDMSIVESLQKRLPTYAHNFPLWSMQSAGMLQYIIWTALEEQGMGASLQHYNELIGNQVKAEWNIPEEWMLISQMPFGKPTAPPDEKTFEPLEKRIKIYH